MLESKLFANLDTKTQNYIKGKIIHMLRRNKLYLRKKFIFLLTSTLIINENLANINDSINQVRKYDFLQYKALDFNNLEDQMHFQWINWGLAEIYKHRSKLSLNSQSAKLITYHAKEYVRLLVDHKHLFSTVQLEKIFDLLHVILMKISPIVTFQVLTLLLSINDFTLDKFNIAYEIFNDIWPTCSHDETILIIDSIMNLKNIYNDHSYDYIIINMLEKVCTLLFEQNISTNIHYFILVSISNLPKLFFFDFVSMVMDYCTPRYFDPLFSW